MRGRCYDGAHDSVHRFAKAWRNERARVPVRAFVPLSFAPGEAYQFDWSHETITLQGLPLTIKVAHMTTALPDRSRQTGGLQTDQIAGRPASSRPANPFVPGCIRFLAALEGEHAQRPIGSHPIRDIDRPLIGWSDINRL